MVLRTLLLYRSCDGMGQHMVAPGPMGGIEGVAVSARRRAVGRQVGGRPPIGQLSWRRLFSWRIWSRPLTGSASKYTVVEPSWFSKARPILTQNFLSGSFRPSTMVKTVFMSQFSLDGETSVVRSSTGTVETSVLDCLGDVFGPDGLGPGEVGDGAGDLQDSVVGPGREAQPGDGRLQQSL